MFAELAKPISLTGNANTQAVHRFEYSLSVLNAPWAATLPLQGNSSTVRRPSLADSQPPVFQPFVPPGENRPEFTFRALLLGSIFGVIFGAVTVYVGLRAGLTVAASIPIAVLSISILRAFGRASILENNIVQTT